MMRRTKLNISTLSPSFKHEFDQGKVLASNAAKAADIKFRSNGFGTRGGECTRVSGHNPNSHQKKSEHEIHAAYKSHRNVLLSVTNEEEKSRTRSPNIIYRQEEESILAKSESL
jgi:hypothetical protein